MMKRLAFLLPLAWMGCIFWFSTDALAAKNTAPRTHSIFLMLFPFLSREMLDWVHVGVRKCGHLSEYALLTLLWANAFWRNTRWEALRVWGLAALIAVGYAATDEWHQSFTRDRQGSVADVGIDAVGAVLAALAGIAYARVRARRRLEKTLN
jgi:VanZ family protein